jgi:hypothetical protein
MKNLKTDCRWCEGEGFLWVMDKPPNDPRCDDVKCPCPECGGGGLVGAAVALEQAGQSAAIKPMIYQQALEDHIEQQADLYSDSY